MREQHERRKNEMMDMIRSILPPDASLLAFDYNEQCFGNIVAEIKSAGKKHVFVTDRGEIYHNGKTLCGEFEKFEKEDTFSKLLYAIKKEFVW